MSQTTQERNKALVLEAFDTLFNKRDYGAAERYWLPTYIQHSAHIAPGREGLFDLIKSMPPTLKYEPGMIVADGDLVIVHGRLLTHDQHVGEFDFFPALIGAYEKRSAERMPVNQTGFLPCFAKTEFQQELAKVSKCDL